MVKNIGGAWSTGYSSLGTTTAGAQPPLSGGMAGFGLHPGETNGTQLFDAPHGGTYTVTVRVTFNNGDQNPANNTATFTVTCNAY